MDVALLNKQLGAASIGDGTWYFKCANISLLPSEYNDFKRKFYSIGLKKNGKDYKPFLYMITGRPRI
jgi:hypothetical protein